MSFSAPLDTLDAREQQLLETFLEPVRFPEGNAILRAGEPGDSLYLIDEGTVRIELGHVEVDTEAVVAYLEPGAILGELSLLDRQPRSAHALAETDVAARRLTAEGLDRLVERHPRIGAAVLRALGADAARKLRHTTSRLAEFLHEEASDPEVDDMVARAAAAQREIDGWDEDRVDALLHAIAQRTAQHATELAIETVRETRVGNAPDKAFKNYIAALGIYQSLAGRVGHGTLASDEATRVTEIASAAGVVFAIIPMTNPVATAVFKTLIAVKSRNAVILSFHRSALGVGNRTGELIRAALEEAGAPTDLVQWIRVRASRQKTRNFMSHPGVSLILATGGAGLVRAAYSSGTPALGVGPGNAPTWICADADLESAAAAIVASKSFDNGLICGAEHNLVVDRAVRDEFAATLERSGAAVLDAREAERFTAAVIDAENGRFTPRIVGQAAQAIADAVGIRRDHPIRLVVVPCDDPSVSNPLAGEKVAPVLSLFTTHGAEEGLDLCRRLIEQAGTGHTAIIHTRDAALIDRFAMRMPASRILVNSPGAQGVVGITTGLDPSFTLGCGTFGGNSTTDNVSYRNLLNVKRLAHYTRPPEEMVQLESAARAEVAEHMAAAT